MQTTDGAGQCHLPIRLKTLKKMPFAKWLLPALLVDHVSGGGGIPVRSTASGALHGLEAVIDEDLAGGERLAEVVDADTFLILTDVDKVKLNFGKENEQELDRITISQAKDYLDQGHFLAGSMGPKVLACIRFLEWGGEVAIIASLDKAQGALAGRLEPESSVIEQFSGDLALDDLRVSHAV